MRHTASTSRTSTQEPPFYSTPGIKHQYPYEANGYPWANLVEDFKAVRKYVPKLMRAFLIHFGGLA